MKQIFSESLSLKDALKALSENLDARGIKALQSEMISVVNALGRVTAVPVYARYSSPSFHSSAMDGYAVRFADTFTASETSPHLLKIGADAIYVDTGDPLPEGFNSVIMIEDVNVINGQPVSFSPMPEYIEIYQPATPYQHVRIIGEDIVATELIVPENHIIRPIDMGAMLASGHIEIAARRKPVVAIIPTGTEIIEPDIVRQRPLKPPEIIEYNSAMLAGLASELGAECFRHPIVSDDLDNIKKAVLETAASSDIVLINAGAGRGKEDYTAKVIADLGEIIINGVAIKPGKPFI
ncbi:MAG: molybdopterin-binding protein, partial [Nitrospirae bacterium]|nr:molybdopterin-binding protein [Nitrospirota bacterium]